ncbi:MAG: ABC transporter ATP-binding protein [Candidatus Njordarchaeia archaeon]
MSQNGVLLRTEGLTRKFGELVAVDNVNLEIRRGEIHAVIGPNGAGKTTLINLISGVLKPTSGRIFFMDRDITNLPPHERAKLGIGRSFQIPSLFPNLTTLENVRLAIQVHMDKINKSFLTTVSDHAHIYQDALKALATVGLYGKTSILARNLTLSDKRKLELAVTIASNPTLLLLDEPTAGISIEELDSMVNVIKKLKSKDRGILLVEHKIDIVLDIADVITVMHHGKIIAEGEPNEIVSNKQVQEIYLGEVEV